MLKAHSSAMGGSSDAAWRYDSDAVVTRCVLEISDRKYDPETVDRKYDPETVDRKYDPETVVEQQIIKMNTIDWPIRLLLEVCIAFIWLCMIFSRNS